MHATPATGTETLFDFYPSVLGGTSAPESDAYAAF